MRINLSNPPLFSMASYTKWDSIQVEGNNLVVSVLPICEEYVKHFDLSGGQVCVFDVSNGPKNAPLIAIYWVKDGLFQIIK